MLRSMLPLHQIREAASRCNGYAACAPICPADHIRKLLPVAMCKAADTASELAPCRSHCQTGAKGSAADVQVQDAGASAGGLLAPGWVDAPRGGSVTGARHLQAGPLHTHSKSISVALCGWHSCTRHVFPFVMRLQSHSTPSASCMQQCKMRSCKRTSCKRTVTEEGLQLKYSHSLALYQEIKAI